MKGTSTPCPHPSFVPAQYHAGCTLSAEEHVPEAECAAAGIRVGVGTDAAALHRAAASPSEQRRAARADPGAQPAIRQGPDGGEPERAGGATGNVHGRIW